jgi:hypothetical protein
VAAMLSIDDEQYASKMHANDRILMLKPKEGVPLDTTSMIDKRLLTGENKLHALFEGETGLWYLRYDQGGLPLQLRQKFTSFNKLLRYVTDYFVKKNIDVKEVIG